MREDGSIPTRNVFTRSLRIELLPSAVLLAEVVTHFLVHNMRLLHAGHAQTTSSDTNEVPFSTPGETKSSALGLLECWEQTFAITHSS